MISKRFQLYLFRFKSCTIGSPYFILAFSCLLKVYSQVDYSSFNFRSPLDIPLYVSGTFGELRSNHFHSGLDIKTMGQEGMKVYAAENGYISRIKISPYGYGKALYVTHPNGFTSVYAHLKEFSPEISAYVVKKQYQKKSYSIELFLPPDKFVLKKGDNIALSGNSGGSGGPHLHFEIRDTKTEDPVNPLLFGLEITDNIPPVIQELSLYQGSTSNEKKMFSVYGSEGTYYLNTSENIKVNKNSGFGIRVYDRLNYVNNQNGVYSIEVWIDSILTYSHTMERFAFYESRYINCHIDYDRYLKTGIRTEKCYLEPNNKLSIYKKGSINRIYKFKPDQLYQVVIKVSDAYKNTSELKFTVAGTSDNYELEKNEAHDIFPYRQLNRFENANLKLELPINTLYDTVYFKYDTLPGLTNGFGPIHSIHSKYIPVHGYYKAWFKVNLPIALRDKALVASLDESKISDKGGKWQNGSIYTTLREFGNFTVMIDTVPPVIRPVNIYQGKSFKNEDKIKLIISDNLSGIENYYPTIDDNWILMEYDAKNNLLTYFIEKDKFDEGKHEFKIKVSDSKENSSIYATIFKLH